MNAVTLHDAFVGAGCATRDPPRPAVTIEAGALRGRRRHNQGGPLCPGRRMHDRGRRGPDPERRLREFLEGVRHGRGEPAGGRDRHRRRRGADRQRLHASGPVLGHQGRWRRQLWGRDPAHAADARPARVLRRRVDDDPGDLGRRVPPADRPIVGFYANGCSIPTGASRSPFGRATSSRSMVFQGLDQQQAEAIWRTFFDWLAFSTDFTIVSGPMVLAAPARHFWDPAFLRELPGLVLVDDRPDAPEANVFRAGNLGEAGQVLHGYRPHGFPSRSCGRTSREVSAMPWSRRPGIGACPRTSTRASPARLGSHRRGQRHGDQSAVVEAFALLISGAEGPPAYPASPVTSLTWRPP